MSEVSDDNHARREELEGQVVVAKFATTTPHGAIPEKTQTHTNLHSYRNIGVFSLKKRLNEKSAIHQDAVISRLTGDLE